MAKVAVDASISMETKQTLDQIIASEEAEDGRNDRPPRSRPKILKMIFKMGCRAWKEKQSLSDGDVGSG